MTREKRQAEEMVQQYLGMEEPKSLVPGDVQKVLAQLSLQGVDWLCVKHSNKVEWLRKEKLQVESLDLPLSVDYDQ